MIVKGDKSKRDDMQRSKSEKQRRGEGGENKKQGKKPPSKRRIEKECKMIMKALTKDLKHRVQ